MIHTIQNQHLQVSASTAGAELRSIRGCGWKTGTAKPCISVPAGGVHPGVLHHRKGGPLPPGKRKAAPAPRPGLCAASNTKIVVNLSERSESKDLRADFPLRRTDHA